jgi:hypothetical protein
MSGEGERHAVVQAGHIETGYRRAGLGPTVVLLATTRTAAADQLFHALAGQFRVIQPAWPGGLATENVAGWLRGVIEGLGLDQPLLVVDEGSAAGAHQLKATLPSLTGAVVSIRADIAELIQALHAAEIMVDS